MGDASFMLNSASMVNIGCPSSLPSYSDVSYRSQFTSYSATSSGIPEYFSETPSQQHLITNSAMPGFPNNFVPSSHTQMPQYSAMLTIEEQPVPRIRYRYLSEKGAHGGLQGVNSNATKKSFPTVRLVSAPSNRKIYVEASLYTHENPHKLHVHKLTGKGCNPESGVCRVELADDGKATFKNLGIMFAEKKKIPDILYERKRSTGSFIPGEDPLEECRKEAKALDVNKVVMCFQAFDADGDIPLTPEVFSTPILNQKSPDSSELKMVKISKHSGVCTGGDEVFLLCEKVNKKEIKVRFFEEENGKTIWEELGVFTENEVHHQVAIVFRTPAYRDQTIQTPVTVSMQLYRPKDNEASEPWDFTYTPVDRDQERIAQKRRKIGMGDGTAYYTVHHASASSSGMKSSSMHSYGSSEHVRGSQTFQMRGSPPSQQQSPMDQGLEAAENDISDLIVFNFSPTSVCQVSSTSDVLTANARPEPTELLSVAASAQQQPTQPNVIPFSENVLDDDESEVITGKDTFMGYKPLYQAHRKDGATSEPDYDVPEVYEDAIANNAKDIAFVDFVKLLAKALQRFLALGSIKFLLRPLRRFLAIQDDDGDNALHYLAVSEHNIRKHSQDTLETVWQLPQSVINETNNLFQTPLQLAVAVGKLDMVRPLLHIGADPNIQDFRGCSAIHLAVMKHQHHCLDAILMHHRTKPNLDMLNFDGLSALHIAVQEGCQDCTLRLCSFGANVNKRDGTSGRTALHMSVLHHPQISDILLKQRDIEIDMQDYCGNTALHLACIGQQLETALKLMKRDANPLIENSQTRDDDDNDDNDDQETKCGMTPFDYSKGNEQLQGILAGTVDSVDINVKSRTSEECAGATVESVVSSTDAKYMNRDSGFISGEVECDVSERRLNLCKALDPPNVDWEKLVPLCFEDSERHISYLRKCESSPTSALLKNFSDEEIPQLLEGACLERYITCFSQVKREVTS